MIVFAIFGVCVNFCAAFFTRDGASLNQKAVNLHMLEDVLGWAVVLIGAIVMKFTDFVFIDPIMSICVAVFILINTIKKLKEVIDVHHIHIWSMDGQNNYATMHIVTNSDSHEIK